MADANSDQPADTALVFRIRLHLGDLIVDGDDLYGDGVNLAERIQVMAEPGGSAVSRAVRDVAELADDYIYVDGGEKRAKIVSRPIHIYRVRARKCDPTL